jgi:hypothetical protein
MSQTNLPTIALWYAGLPERNRQGILSALGESDRRLAFYDGRTVPFDHLPQYAKNLVIDEWHLLHPPTTKQGAANDNCNHA